MGKWIRNNSLWLVGVGLMLASSGLDGVYMSKWMPGGWGWLGLILNTMADVSGMVLMFWYGRLQRMRNVEKRLWSRPLLLAEVVAVGYSWLFSWRQLRRVLPEVEPDDWQWVSLVAAGFIPLLLAFIGYAQSLRDTATQTLARTPAEPELAETATLVAKVAAENGNGVQKLPRVKRLPLIKEQLDAAKLRGEHITDQQLGDLFGVSRQQAGNDRKVALEVAGNGSGRGNGGR